MNQNTKEITLWTVVTYCSTPPREQPVEFAVSRSRGKGGTVTTSMVTTRKPAGPSLSPKSWLFLHCWLNCPVVWEQTGGAKNLSRMQSEAWREQMRGWDPASLSPLSKHRTASLEFHNPDFKKPANIPRTPEIGSSPLHGGYKGHRTGFSFRGRAMWEWALTGFGKVK